MQLVLEYMMLPSRDRLASVFNEPFRPNRTGATVKTKFQRNHAKLANSGTLPDPRKTSIKRQSPPMQNSPWIPWRRRQRAPCPCALNISQYRCRDNWRASRQVPASTSARNSSQLANRTFEQIVAFAQTQKKGPPYDRILAPFCIKLLGCNKFLRFSVYIRQGNLSRIF